MSHIINAQGLDTLGKEDRMNEKGNGVSSPLQRGVTFLPQYLKDEHDEKIRRDLAPDLAEGVIKNNRSIRAYLIQRPICSKVNEYCYTTTTGWETLEVVECDWDDAISYKEVAAKKYKINKTRLRLIPR